MADFFVAVLTTLVILFFSVLFWKWINRRNQLIIEERTQMRISKTDVRNNRLRKFDKTPIYLNENRGDFIDGKPSNATEAGVLLAEDAPAFEEETPLIARKVLDEIKDERPLKNNDTDVDTRSSVDIFEREATAINETIASSGENPLVFEIRPSPSAAKSPPKVANTRKWVSLSEETEVSLPETRPLTNLVLLMGWNEGFDEFNVSNTSLRRASDKLEARPRTLVCHDMKGGYLEDRYVQGYPSAECYCLYHWQYIDIFVYFSHNFVTIPPPCWTNAAHQHGVQVLGTVITEWEDGAKQCAEMFSDQNSYQTIADQLVYIAKYYRFDGWLINIENPIQPSQMNNLTEFMKYLTSEMHNSIPGSLVIWYDSVTYKGELKWQNELNPENRVFFDVSDGIFLNYLWDVSKLTMSSREAGQSRRYDVYVGVDVFGRGCYGGGGWNTSKATKVIKNHDLSLALFAPGWVYEKYQSTFKTSQDKFWNAIASDCTIHTFESTLPFVTSFCQGYGNKVLENGKVVWNNPWTHLGAQQIQPSYSNHIYSLGGQHGVLITTMEHSCQDAYNGGGCLLLQGSTKPTQTSSKVVVRVFKTDILLPSTVLVSFTTKLEPSNAVDVALQLHVDRKPTYIMLCPADEENSQDSEDNIDSVDQVLLQRYRVRRSKQLSSDHLAIAVGQEHYRLFAPVSRDEHNTLHAMCGTEDGNLTSPWCTRYYLLAEKDLKGSRIKEIRLVLMNKTSTEPLKETCSTQFQLFWGDMKIIDAVSLRRPLPTVTHLHCRESEVNVQTKDNNMVMLSLTLTWSYDTTNTDPWERFKVYHVPSDDDPTTLLGWSFVTSFVVSNLTLSRTQKQVKFAVQAIDRTCRKQPLEYCPTIVIHWT